MEQRRVCSSGGVLGVGIRWLNHPEKLLGKAQHLCEGNEGAGERPVAALSRRLGPGLKRGIEIHGMLVVCA